MLDALHQLFSWVCGQGPTHTWSPDGELLPCCQRCTGLYVGAFVAALLHLIRPPQATGFWLRLNGAFLLFMVPAGFHWFAQGPELRAASGIFFGFGLVAFLWLPLRNDILSEAEPRNSQSQLGIFFVALFATIIGTPLLGMSDISLAATTLALLTAGGALALALLLFANIFLAARGLWRWLFQPTPHMAA